MYHITLFFHTRLCASWDSKNGSIQLCKNSTDNADVIITMFYAYPSFFTILTLTLFVIVLVVCHWSVKKCAPSCLCNLFFIIIYYKSKLKGKKIVCQTDGTDLEAKESIEISGRNFPAGLNIDYSNLVIRGEIGEGNFGKVYQGYLQMNDVQR